MTTNDPDETLARAVAARRWGAGGVIDVRKLNQGSNNTVHVASVRSETVIIKLSRPHREAGALGEYRKEAWCAARVSGVPTPKVLDLGMLNGRAFAVLAYVDGHPPAESLEESSWNTLGRYARSIHDVAVEGWGGTLTEDGRFGESWQAHLDYNIASLTAGDALIARGVIDAGASHLLRSAFERIKQTEFRFGLCHGDVALWNTLIDESGRQWLMDWGCAAAHVVPHYEINEILRGPRPPPEHLEAFLDGYGLSREAYAAMTPDLRALAALREVDTLRWALDRKPDMVEEMTARARAAVGKLIEAQ